MQSLVTVGNNAMASRSVGVRVMLLTDQPDGASASRLSGYGSVVTVEDRLDAVLAGLAEDALGYDLFVMDCDGFGGIEAGERAVAALIAADARMRVMLIGQDFDVPVYPLGRRTAVCLPVGGSDSAFRRGFDHVLRDRATVTIM